MTALLTVALDAAATTGTIALLRGAELLAAREVEMRSDAEERFLPAILDTLLSMNVQLADVDRFVCGEGPGSFTSLRVAAAVAKGLAEGLGRPLFAVPSAALIVAASPATRHGSRRWLTTLDAMRNERYVAVVTLDAEGEALEVTGLGVVATGQVPLMASRLDATLIGPGEAVSALPHARGLTRCSGIVASAGPVDLPSWEPRYGRLAEAQVKWEATHGRAL